MLMFCGNTVGHGRHITVGSTVAVMSQDRRRPLTAEQIADAERLKKLFIERAGVSQAEFGDRFGIGTQGHVSQYLNAKRALNMPVAIRFAQGLGVPVDAFSPSIAAAIGGASPSSGLAEVILSMEESDALEALDYLQFKAGRSKAIRANEPPHNYTSTFDVIRRKVRARHEG